MCRDFICNSDGELAEELQSLGLDVKKKSNLGDREELQVLIDILKQSMYHDYKTAYSRADDSYREEAYATLR